MLHQEKQIKCNPFTAAAKPACLRMGVWRVWLGLQKADSVLFDKFGLVEMIKVAFVATARMRYTLVPRRIQASDNNKNELSFLP